VWLCAYAAAAARGMGRLSSPAMQDLGACAAGLGFPRVIRDNRGMAKKDRAEAAAENDIHVLIEDAQELTPKELDQERKAALEERQRRSWLSHTPEQLANRIPVSVFAMGDLVAPN
jgi:hypothetical protein